MYLYGHPDELCLEDCVRAGNSTLPQFVRTREHVQGCAMCQERMAEMAEYMQFMRTVPEETAGELILKRETGKGTIFLIVTGSDATQWEGRAIGAGCDVFRTFRRGPEALEWLERWFGGVMAEEHAALCTR